MSKRLKRKSILMIIVEILCLVLLGFFLFYMQTELAIQNQQADTKQKLEQMDDLIHDADEEAAQATEAYDEVYQSKAESIAYMILRQVDPEYNDATLAQYADMMNISNILILDRAGNVLASGSETPTDFTYERYNQLKTVFRTGKPSVPFNVRTGDETFRYFGAKIDDNRMVVVENDPEELDGILDNTSSWKSILGNVSVGLDGYAFAVSSQDYTFLYHPDKELIGDDALDAGVAVDQLEDNNYTWLTVNGERLYCGITLDEPDKAYIICAVTEKEITSSRNVTVGIILFIFFAVITLVITYAIFMMMDEEASDNIKSEGFRKIGNLYYSIHIGRKLRIITLIGLICILVISFYMQTLFSLSCHAMSNRQHAAEVEMSTAHNGEIVDLIQSQYDRRYLNKAQVAAYIMTKKPELQTKPDLIELSKVLDVEQISIFDESGAVSATSSPRTNFKISDDPEDQSYDFNVLLIGEEYLIQDAQVDQVSQTYKQYIGVSLRDEQDNANGFLQIRITPSKLQEVMKTTRIAHILNGIKVGTNGFAFAVNKEKSTFSTFPDEKLRGRPVTEYGMKESQLHDGYNDYIQINGKKYFASSLETDHYLIYIATPEEELTNTRVQVTLLSAGISLLCLLLVFLLLTLSKSPETEAAAEERAADGQNSNVRVRMPDGTIRKSDSASSRWSNAAINWSHMSPDERFLFLMKALVSVFAIGISIAILFKDKVFGEDSIFTYIISGQWERGVNIFALTSCILIICVVGIITMIVRWILKSLARALNARGETICRLLNSFIKYGSIIAILYYCLALVGVDTATLVASAGILTLVVGLGANKLVSDILAGLFIIFEGEFRVGDIITIGDWRGTVVEIGIRTTKVEDGVGNVKVISNSSVSGVINMTKKYSFASINVGIEYGESLERVETILAEELPKFKDRLPAIVDGPFYRGVTSLGDNSVNLGIAVQCKESDRIGLERDLNRQMKLIFDKYDINIPFPQIVINEPIEYQKATLVEKLKAEQFLKEQQQKTKGLRIDEDDEEQH